ncbi:MAG: IscS subfamily cysteine desulfurase [Oscillospiraceae bacterium]|jgi:cysteine desulfurase|nr:IscS subfamily cysteine desulfurase [Oscillospiraceae bacterium]
MLVYADNAATTKMSQAAIDIELSLMREVFGNPSSLHSAGQRAKEVLEEARATIAECLGAEPREIYFTSGGSEADNQAIMTAVNLGARKGKKHLVSTAIEHHAILHALEAMKARGCEVTLVPVGRNGIVSAADIAEAIREDTALVTVMAANNEIGTIQPIEEIASLCKERGVIFHTDAVQAVGHIPIDVKAMNVDLLSLSAHKFHGPKGVGVLYCRRGLAPAILIEGGAQERGRRAGTENLPAIAAMARALKDACDNMAQNAVFVGGLRDRLIDGLSVIPHSVLNGDREKRLPNNVNMCFEGVEGEALLLMLDRKGIEASSGSACTSGSLDPSHVLLALGLPHEVAHGSLRLSLSEYNTPEEMDWIVEQVPLVINRLRDMSPVWEGLEDGSRPHII